MRIVVAFRNVKLPDIKNKTFKSMSNNREIEHDCGLTRTVKLWQRD